MDRLNRTDSSYLKLFTQEHELLNNEKISQHNYKIQESEERDLFFRFSALLRESQEKERARAERIKYLQLFLSVACTFLGLLSALLISFLRRTEIKEILEYERDSYTSLADKFESFNKNQKDLNENFSKILLNPSINSKDSNNQEDFFIKQNKFLTENFNEIQRIINELNFKNKNNSSLKNEINELDFNKKLCKQQDLLKIISITTVLSTFFLSIIYFKGV